MTDNVARCLIQIRWQPCGLGTRNQISVSCFDKALHRRVELLCADQSGSPARRHMLRDLIASRHSLILVVSMLGALYPDQRAIQLRLPESEGTGMPQAARPLKPAFSPV